MIAPKGPDKETALDIMLALIDACRKRSVLNTLNVPDDTDATALHLAVARSCDVTIMNTALSLVD